MLVSYEGHIPHPLTKIFVQVVTERNICLSSVGEPEVFCVVLNCQLMDERNSVFKMNFAFKGNFYRKYLLQVAGRLTHIIFDLLNLVYYLHISNVSSKISGSEGTRFDRI